MMIARMLPRFRAAERALTEMESRENWSRRQIEDFQLQRINAIWRDAVRQVPHYRELSRQIGIGAEGFGTLEEYRNRVPVLTRDAVRQRSASLLSERATAGVWRRTGGSTGTPMRVFWGREAHRQSLWAKYRFQASWGVDIFDRSAFLWGHGASLAPGWRGAVSRWRQPWIDWMRNRLRMSAYRMDRSALREYLREIERFGPKMLYGYSRALELLAREAGVGFACPALKVVVATSEPLWRWAKELMETALKAPVAEEYGAVEAGIIATESPVDRTLRVREDRVMVETIPNAEGRWEIVLSVLGNEAFPMLRYGIADMTSAELERPIQGFAVLKDVIGRQSDLLVSRAGRVVHWVSVEHTLSALGVGAIRRYRMVQRADGRLEVEVELGGAVNGAEVVGALQTRMEAYLEGFAVEVRVVEKVEQTAAGKHRGVSSEMVGGWGESPEANCNRIVHGAAM